ncbi:MAG: hypothetical protein CL916_01425 [Deltaproteobacteria bacterium]|nr:hypothetical protein [Deltaproteobacteria bacterium]
MKLSLLNFFLYLLIFFVFSAHVYHYAPHATDDAFIFYRYVNHIVDGNGIVWNKGELPVEGFSSPLWIFLLTIGKLFGVPLPIFSLIIGVLSILGTVLIMIIILNYKSILGLISVAVLLCFGSVYYWSLSGMETGLFMLCFLASFVSIHIPSFRYWVLLLGLTRPEGFLLMIPWSILWARVHPQKRGFIFWAWLPTIVYFLFRLLYFDAWLPNTYYAKVGASLLERLGDGFMYATPVLLCLLTIGLTFRSSIGTLLLSLFMGCTAQVCIVILGGGDWMTWGRMLVPMFPFIIIMTSIQIARGYRFLIVITYFLFPFSTPFAAWPAMIQGKTLPITGFQEGGLYNISKEIALDIRKNIPKGATIAINHAGFLPYLLSDYNFIDMTGLNDRFIAHHAKGGLHQKYDVEYVLQRKPELVVFNSFIKPAGKKLSLQYWMGETALYEHPSFLKQYQMVPIYYERERFGGGNAYILLFSRYSNTD